MDRAEALQRQADGGLHLPAAGSRRQSRRAPRRPAPPARAPSLPAPGSVRSAPAGHAGSSRGREPGRSRCRPAAGDQVDAPVAQPAAALRSVQAQGLEGRAPSGGRSARRAPAPRARRRARPTAGRGARAAPRRGTGRPGAGARAGSRRRRRAPWPWPARAARLRYRLEPVVTTRSCDALLPLGQGLGEEQQAVEAAIEGSPLLRAHAPGVEDGVRPPGGGEQLGVVLAPAGIEVQPSSPSPAKRSPGRTETTFRPLRPQPLGQAGGDTVPVLGRPASARAAPSGAAARTAARPGPGTSPRSSARGSAGRWSVQRVDPVALALEGIGRQRHAAARSPREGRPVHRDPASQSCPSVPSDARGRQVPSWAWRRAAGRPVPRRRGRLLAGQRAQRAPGADLQEHPARSASSSRRPSAKRTGWRRCARPVAGIGRLLGGDPGAGHVGDIRHARGGAARLAAARP